MLGIGAVAYAALALQIGRNQARHGRSMLSYLMLLFAGLLAGSAFSYGASTVELYNVGRALSFIAAGFLPLSAYLLYTEYSSTRPGKLPIGLLLVIPVVTIAMALTNSSHSWLWAAYAAEDGLRVSSVTDHGWYTAVYAPYVYGLVGVAGITMAARLPSLAAAHRKTVSMLLACAMLPFAVNIANTFLAMGPPDFPLSSATLAVLWPAFAYFGLQMRVYGFSPMAYRTLFNNVRDPIFVVDNDQRLVCANHAAEILLGSPEKDMLGQKLWEDFPAASEILEQARTLDLTQTLRMDGDNDYEVSVNPLTGIYGQTIGMVVVCRDVTERRKAAARIAESEHMIRTLIETSSNGILRFRRDGNDPDMKYRCVFANRAAQKFVGEPDDALVGMPLGKLEILEPKRLLAHLGKNTESPRPLNYEIPAEGESGTLWLRVVVEPVGEDFAITLVDITRRKQHEQKMLADALKDPLTGTLNRRGFEAEGRAALQGCETGAVLYLDLNEFKSINDGFGHDAGDALLKAFGHRLEFCLRPEDVIGRMGGDEFAIVMPGVTPDDVRQIAQRFVQTASEPYIIQTREIKCTASVGIALMPRHGDELWKLLNIADRAMYDAKEESGTEDCAAYIESAIAS